MGTGLSGVRGRFQQAAVGCPGSRGTFKANRKGEITMERSVEVCGYCNISFEISNLTTYTQNQSYLSTKLYGLFGMMTAIFHTCKHKATMYPVLVLTLLQGKREHELRGTTR